MKPDIHPKYIENAEIKCVCGNVIKVGSSKKEMSVEICSNCHPFFTGKENLIDTAGRVEKFQARMKKAAEAPKKVVKAKKEKKPAKTKPHTALKSAKVAKPKAE